MLQILHTFKLSTNPSLLKNFFTSGNIVVGDRNAANFVVHEQCRKRQSVEVWQIYLLVFLFLTVWGPV